MTRDEIVKSIMDEIGEEEAKEVLLADGLEDAFVGVVRQFNGPPMACYNYDICILVLMRKEGMSVEEAHEWMSYNVTGAWVGQNTPAFLYPIHYNEEDTQDLKIGGTD